MILQQDFEKMFESNKLHMKVTEISEILKPEKITITIVKNTVENSF